MEILVGVLAAIWAFIAEAYTGLAGTFEKNPWMIGAIAVWYLFYSQEKLINRRFDAIERGLDRIFDQGRR